VRAIRHLVDDRLPTRVGIVLMEANRAHAKDTAAFLEGLGLPADAISFDYQRAVGRGVKTPEPAWHDRPDGGKLLGSHRGAPSDTFSGRACVSYDNTVYPCIFSRMFPLGDVTQTRLRDILMAPAPVHVDRQRLSECFERWRSELTCGDCRVRASLLARSNRRILSTVRA
jgi:MoaA/NifB/PqqE/SkfB family radical SAM enzyme